MEDQTAIDSQEPATVETVGGNNRLPETTPAVPGETLGQSEQGSDGKAAENEKVSRPTLVKAVFSAIEENATDQVKEISFRTIERYLKQVIGGYACCNKYNIIVLYDESTLVKQDADRIYDSVTKFKNREKPLLMVLYSNGGEASSAYLIGKLCREYSEGKFIITIPRMAKSAASLICCAANEIHMGSLSEPGPIDPQINKLPALGLKYSVEHIADLVKRYPASSEMFAKYLNYSLELIHLGYYERVAESAMQYAEKLLTTHSSTLPRTPNEIAMDLVYKYKDHGFVIDKAEASEIFGADTVKMNSEVYELGNSLYKALDFMGKLAGVANHNFYFIGSLESNAVFTRRK